MTVKELIIKLEKLPDNMRSWEIAMCTGVDEPDELNKLIWLKFEDETTENFLMTTKLCQNQKQKLISRRKIIGA